MIKSELKRDCKGSFCVCKKMSKKPLYNAPKRPEMFCTFFAQQPFLVIFGRFRRVSK